MINIYTRNNIDAKSYIKPSSSGNYDGTIAWDIEVVSAPLTYSLVCQGPGNINWGDGTNEDVSHVGSNTSTSHTYNTTGTHTIILTGDIISFRAGGDYESKTLVRTIHSMSLAGYLGNNQLYTTGEFGSCMYATMSDNFKFANSILYLLGSFYQCHGIVTVPPTFALPRNVENLESTFRYCDGNIVMPATFNIPNSVTNMTGLFRSARGITFTSTLVIPVSVTNISYLFFGASNSNLAKVQIHSGVNNFSYTFAESGHIQTPIWPESFSSSYINVNHMCYHTTAPSTWETLKSDGFPADLFWLNISKNWLSIENAFTNAKHLSNYSSIPSAWGGGGA